MSETNYATDRSSLLVSIKFYQYENIQSTFDYIFDHSTFI